MFCQVFPSSDPKWFLRQVEPLAWSWACTGTTLRGSVLLVDFEWLCCDCPETPPSLISRTQHETGEENTDIWNDEGFTLDQFFSFQSEIDVPLLTCSLSLFSHLWKSSYSSGSQHHIYPVVTVWNQRQRKPFTNPFFLTSLICGLSMGSTPTWQGAPT